MLIDSSKSHSFSYDELLEQASESCDWLISQGVRVDATRLALQIKSIRRLASTINRSKTVNDYWELLWKISDIDEIIQISKNLREVRDERFISTLQKITNGPALLSDENPSKGSNQGRDAAFELFTAARLARSGIPITFDSLADITATLDNCRIAVECKRISSADMLDYRITQSHSQIKERIRTNDASIGIIAISVTKLVHQVTQENPNAITGDPQFIKAIFRDLLANLGQPLLNTHGVLASEAAAIILHYKLPFINEHTGKIEMLSRFAHYPLSFGLSSRIDELNRKLNLSLMDSIHNSKY